jgi:hypothetical protein
VRWRVVLGVAVVPLLGVELVLAAPTLAKALNALEGAQPWWIAAGVLAAATSMDLFARMRRRLLRAAGVRVRMRDAPAAVYVADAVHRTVPGGAVFSTTYAYRWMRGGRRSTAVPGEVDHEPVTFPDHREGDDRPALDRIGGGAASRQHQLVHPSGDHHRRPLRPIRSRQHRRAPGRPVRRAAAFPWCCQG